jgi:large subunit ribosomal protein L10Ae
MSKLSNETVSDAVKSILKFSAEKKRKFLETIELQVALKNYDPQKDKRFSGVIDVPNTPRENFSVCLLGTEKDCNEATKAGVESKTVEDLKKLNKNKKLVKKLAASYDAFLASATLIRKIPRLLGPGLNKAGKFPAVFNAGDDIATKVLQLKQSVKFQLKSKKTTCMGVAIANVGMKEEDATANIVLAVNFLVSLLPKAWQNVKRLYIKSTMGPSHRIFGF